MGVLRYKIINDLWKHRGRTLQVMLIIGIGAAAIGMILGTRDLVIPGMQDQWQAIQPASMNFFVGPPVTEDELEVLKRIDDVKQVEGASATTIEWRLNPADEWKQGGLNARTDYESQQLNTLELLEGDWPAENALALGQDGDTFYGIPKNSTVYLRVNGREEAFPLSGMVYNMFVQPAAFGGTPQFYASQETYERLTESTGFGQLLISTTYTEYSEEQTAEVADRVQDRLEDMDKGAARFLIDPNKHFFQDQLDGLFFLLGVLGMLALVLGLLLVYNTINALITSQVDQIGVMKAIGARTGQVFRFYLLMVLAYGVLSLLVSLPIGVFGAWGITSWLIGSFGANAGEFDYSTTAIIVMVVISLFAPLAAALIPIIGAARVTVRAAISTYGLGTGVGLFERLLSKIKIISRLALITITNTFRHKRRVFLLQVALVLSGLMFMMVVSVRDSVVYTIQDVIFTILGADVTFVLQDFERINYLEELTLAHPEVDSAEMWGLTNPKIRARDQAFNEDDEEAFMLGIPLPTDLYGYQLRAGRWLTPEDDYAVVLNQKIADDIGVGVGDWITVHYGEKNERDYQVVGLVFDPILTTSANVPREPLLRDLGQVGRAITIWITLTDQDPERQIEVAKQLRAYYEDNFVDISPQRGVFGIGGDATVEAARTFINQFNFLVVLLAIMALVIASVGSIALSGALSLSVMERRREIGVMRAIGASSWAIFRLFIGEGLLLGWLSWLIALPLSLPAGRVMVQALGSAFQIDLVYNNTPTGAIAWFVIITFLSIMASWLPARGATRISVRESLAYQ